MTGLSSVCSPEPAPAVWLCPEAAETGENTVPAWLTGPERLSLARIQGARRREFLSSRWLIRQAIARACGQSPDYCQPVAGRPVASARPAGWHLSLSHSHGFSGCAVGPRPAIGLDIEPLQRHPLWQKVVRRWFSEREQAWLLAADSSTPFLQAWTLKEAWLKATGRGIAGNLQTLEVLPGQRLLGDCQEPDWQAATGRVNGFMVSLVYRGNGFPSGSLLAAPGPHLDAEIPAWENQAIDWQFHRAIEPQEQANHG